MRKLGHKCRKFCKGDRNDRKKFLFTTNNFKNVGWKY